MTIWFASGAPVLALALAASAHPLGHPKRDRLLLSREGIALEVDEEIAAGEAARSVRALFDRNQDGRLDEQEQAALLAHLVTHARLHQSLEVDGATVALQVDPSSPRGAHLDEPAASTALLAVRVTLRAPWPPGGGDWRGRRKLVFRDDAPDTTGHVPLEALCRGCSIVDSSLGAFAHDSAGSPDGEVDRVLGAEVSPRAPLELKIKL